MGQPRRQPIPPALRNRPALLLPRLEGALVSLRLADRLIRGLGGQWVGPRNVC